MNDAEKKDKSFNIVDDAQLLVQLIHNRHYAGLQICLEINLYALFIINSCNWFSSNLLTNTKVPN